MAIQPAAVQYGWSSVRNEDVEVSRLFDDGFLFLEDDPGLWIQSSTVGLLLSVRSLELFLWGYKDDGRIGDSIGELSQLTHLCIRGGVSLKCLPNTISRLQNLHHLELSRCKKLQELPANLGDLDNLTSLTVWGCDLLKSLPNSVAKLSKLTTLSMSYCHELEAGGFQSLRNSVANLSKLTTLNLSASSDLQELPSNLGDLELLTTLFLDGCDSLRSLPWSITKLSKLRFLYLPEDFRLKTLPPHMNDYIIISVYHKHVRKTWKELKTEIKFPIIPVELAEEAALKTSAPGYLIFNRDPTPWIRGNYDILSSVRVLDLKFGYGESQNNIPDSIGELPQLTHLYIIHGCLHRLPLPFNRIVHLSLIYCTFECDIESHFDSLGRLSNLVSLHLQTGFGQELPKHRDFPISLRHLTLALSDSLSDSYMVSMEKLTNLETLNLCCCFQFKSFPLNSKFNKLILRSSRINSVPIGLKHLEIIHDALWCFCESCDELPEYLNQGVNLETVSHTCSRIKSFSIVTTLHNWRELLLKDCFNLRELPPNMDELVKLCSLNVSGTRIKSLPNSITKLRNLRRLILPKCFNLESLPLDFEYKVLISVDDTDENYYVHANYHSSVYGILKEGDYLTSDSIKGINDMFLRRFRQENEETVNVQPSPHRLFNHVPDATQNIEGIEGDGIVPVADERFSNLQGNTRQICATLMELQGSHFTGGNNAVDEDNPHARCSLQHEEIETLPLSNRDCSVTSVSSVHEVAAGSSLNLRKTISFCENGQEPLEMEQEITPYRSMKSVEAGSSYPTLENEQDQNARRDKVKNKTHLASKKKKKKKNKTQKIKITLESIQRLLPQNISLVDAANRLKVSRSTMKRALKKYGIPWPSSRKRKLQDANENERHNTESSSRRNSSHLNYTDPSNPAGHDYMLEHLDGPNQPTMSDHVQSEPTAVNELTSDAVTRTVEEPPMSTQCHTDGHQRVEEQSNGSEKCAMLNSVQPSESGSTFVVKATYNKDTVRFLFSLSSSIEQLKEEVGKRFELEVSKIKMKYQDEDKEWMLMTCVSDLQHALQLSKSSGNNAVRLSIELKK